MAKKIDKLDKQFFSPTKVDKKVDHSVTKLLKSDLKKMSERRRQKMIVL